MSTVDWNAEVGKAKGHVRTWDAMEFSPFFKACQVGAKPEIVEIPGKF